MTFCSHQTSSPYVYNLNGPHDYREITISLVNGVDISFVDPELYSNLLPYIDRYILKFQDRNDASSVNRLKFCKEYILQYPERERIAKILTKRKKDPPPSPPPFNSDQLDAEIDKLLNLKKIDSSNTEYSPKEIDQLLTEMRNRRLIAAEEEDLDLADRLTLVSSQLSSQGAINQIRKIKVDKAKEMKIKLNEAIQTYDNLKERWETIQANFKEETTKEIIQMKEKQKNERIEIEKKRNGPIPPKYRKHTPEYLNLKQEEKMLVSSKRFDEATMIQQRVRIQEELEERMMIEGWHSIIDRDLKKLEEKHKQQLKVREMNIKKEQNIIDRTKKKELDALKSKITFLENQIHVLECYDSTNQDKKSNANVEAPVNNEEEEEKYSNNLNNEEEDESYYYSYNEPDEVENEKYKSDIALNGSTDEVFFIKNNKTDENDGNNIENINTNFVIHPPQDDHNRKSYKRKNKNGNNSITNSQNENKNNDQNEINPKKTPKIRSSGFVGNPASLPRLKTVNKSRQFNGNKNGPEAFRQRALLNKQIYCGKTLLSQHAKNQKDDQRKKRKTTISDNSI